jgi:hypothetical protein
MHLLHDCLLHLLSWHLLLHLHPWEQPTNNKSDAGIDDNAQTIIIIHAGARRLCGLMPRHTQWCADPTCICHKQHCLKTSPSTHMQLLLMHAMLPKHTKGNMHTQQALAALPVAPGMPQVAGSCAVSAWGTAQTWSGSSPQTPALSSSSRCCLQRQPAFRQTCEASVNQAIKHAAIAEPPPACRRQLQNCVSSW